jgi:diacylglycerol kinase
VTKSHLHTSFANAIWGLGEALARERNLRIHVGIALAVVVVGAILRIAAWEWAVLTLTIGFVITVELINTALEAAVDLATQETHPLAKLSKDVAGGAVLVASLAAVAIGVFVLGPHLLARLR